MPLRLQDLKNDGFDTSPATPVGNIATIRDHLSGLDSNYPEFSGLISDTALALEELQDSDLESLPLAVRIELNKKLSAFALALTQPVDGSDQLRPVALLIDLWEQLPLAQSFLRVQRVSQEWSANTDFAELERLISRAKEDVASTQRSAVEAQNAAEQARLAANVAAVSTHAAVFEAEAKRHRRASRLWLAAGALLGAAACVWTVLAAFAVGAERGQSTADAIHDGVARILVLTLLIAGMTVALKTFRAHVHNTVVNTHRANSLRTFETFIDATQNEEVKNAILIETTRTIFSAAPTGFASGDEGLADSNVSALLKAAAHS